MKKQILYSFFIFLSLSAQAQFAPNFEITDTEGEVHRLYEDYLDHGKTVVIKFFFVGCPPCTNIAPAMQQLYVDWGEGQADTQFFEFSTQEPDTDESISNYLGNLNVTIPASGPGGGNEAAQIYMMGEFGTFFGTPAFAVIAPDRNVVYFNTSSNLTQLHNAILETGAEPVVVEEEEEEEEEEMPESTTYTFEFKDAFGEIVDNVNITLADISPNNNTSYPLALNSFNEFEIVDLTEEYPGINIPKFIFSKDGNFDEGLNPIDLITIQKHILDIKEITDPDLILASDSNDNGTITSTDLIVIQKVILGLRDDFPNGAANWIFKQNDIPADISPGETIDIEVEMVKRGNSKG